MMRVNYLSLTNFRNYARLELPLPAQPLVLYGENAQGKTSLLEALYYLATSRSPYTNSDRQLIHWRTEGEPQPFARVVAEVDNRHSQAQRLEKTLLLEHGARFKKVIRLNGVDKRVMDIVGVLNVVLFLPQDLALVEGSPSERRRWMDATLSQVDGAYLEALEQYDKVLAQRNALLKRIQDRKAKPAELDIWNEALAQAGAVIIAGRQGFLRQLEGLAQSHHAALTARHELLTLHYQPSFAPTARDDGQRSFGVLGLDLHRDLSAEQIAPQLQHAFSSSQADDIQRGATQLGPHRDDLRMHINERDCSLYGSRGQARTTILALKLAEVAWMRDCLGEAPLLLLDEVIAELDSKRRAQLLERLDGQAQTLVTTTELDIFPPAFLERAAVKRIVNGQVVAY